ncbi:MAG: hypothetical protein FWH37_09270 [Candidatus Bathyarchaeota archaeon]|nr:hypothetical protein [Candidatus Termiticorpusculum sp.]
MPTDKIQRDYAYLLDYFPEETIRDRARYWRKKIGVVLEKADVEDKSTINARRLSYAVCDYFADILRLT